MLKEFKVIAPSGMMPLRSFVELLKAMTNRSVSLCHKIRRLRFLIELGSSLLFTYLVMIKDFSYKLDPCITCYTRIYNHWF